MNKTPELPEELDAYDHSFDGTPLPFAIKLAMLDYGALSKRTLPHL